MNFKYLCSECGTEAIQPSNADEVMTCAQHPQATIDSVVSTSARAMGAKGGAAKTKAKRKAAAENGKKGGRPKEVTLQGFKTAYNAAVNLMDADLREELHRKHAGKISEQLFLDRYCAAHRKKFGVEFQVN